MKWGDLLKNKFLVSVFFIQKRVLFFMLVFCLLSFSFPSKKESSFLSVIKNRFVVGQTNRIESDLIIRNKCKKIVYILDSDNSKVVFYDKKTKESLELFFDENDILTHIEHKNLNNNYDYHLLRSQEREECKHHMKSKIKAF